MVSLTQTHVAGRLFELGVNRLERPEYPSRSICRAIRIRNAPETEPIDAWTISATPDTVEGDCSDELEPGTEIQLRLADDTDDEWCPAIVQFCVGTPIGYVFSLLCERTDL